MRILLRDFSIMGLRVQKLRDKGVLAADVDPSRPDYGLFERAFCVKRQYVPDFLVSARVAEGDTPLTVVVEVSGTQRRDKRDKEVKVATAREMWVTRTPTTAVTCSRRP